MRTRVRFPPPPPSLTSRSRVPIASRTYNAIRLGGPRMNTESSATPNHREVDASRALARRARRRLRRHRHQPAVRAARVLPRRRTAVAADARERARRAVAGLLVARARHRLGQVPASSSCAPTTAARAASWRCALVAPARAAAPRAGRRSSCSACSARRCSTATA